MDLEGPKLNIKFKDIKVKFDEVSILKGIDLEVKNKAFVGIIGPNGSGKSTLLKCLYRVIKANGGHISLDDHLLENFSLKESSKKMAVVAQHNEHQFDFSVFDMVLLGRTPHKKFLEKDNAEDYKIVNEALEKVGMSDYLKRSYGTLSGGEKQRIILARALAQKAECLILDEPTNHLDIKYQLQIMGIAQKLNITTISAFHDLNIAALFCDKLVAMKDGQIYAQGSPETVLTKENISALYEVSTTVSKDPVSGKVHIRYTPENF